MTITTKYANGEQVFILHKDKIVKSEIVGIHIKKQDYITIQYDVNIFVPVFNIGLNVESVTKFENQCFLTREELINSL